MVRLYNPIIQLPGIYKGDVEWGDYDNDGDLDLDCWIKRAGSEYMQNI